MNKADAGPAERERSQYEPRKAAWVLALLTLVYVFNFIDRQIVGILAIPIKADLGLTDTQLGLMGGLAFAVLYSVVGIPIAWLADRANRKAIITVALVAWSAMTAVCGLAQNFVQLLLARIGVGIGEGGGVAPAYSLISDYFPPRLRGRALAAYSFGIPIGGALGIALGGWVASVLDWRAAFIVVGLAGVLLAPVVALTIREPERGRFDPPRESIRHPAFRDVLRTLSARPSFWYMAFGAATASTIGYGMFFWLPSFFIRSFGVSLLDASLYYAGGLLVGGIVGLWAGGWLADRLGAANRRFYAIVPGAAFLAAMPCYALAIGSDSLMLCVAMLVLPNALGVVWFGPVLAAIQQLVPVEMRATASAVFMFINNLLGLGLGTLGIGALSDALTREYGGEALRVSILAGTTLYLVAAGLYFIAAWRIERDLARG